MEPERLSEGRRRVVDLLKRRGASTAGGLAKELGLTAVAVRQHMQGLEEIGWVESRVRKPQGRGRPCTLWNLTAETAGLFPDRHGDLATGLVDSVRQTFGEEGLERLLEHRAQEQTELYRTLVPAELPLKDRLEALALQRSVEGYMAEVVEEDPETFTLVEHHCPICVAAKKCVGLCAAELEVFRRTLGEEVEVRRTLHLLQDDDRCAYQVRLKEKEA